MDARGCNGGFGTLFSCSSPDLPVSNVRAWICNSRMYSLISFQANLRPSMIWTALAGVGVRLRTDERPVLVHEKLVELDIAMHHVILDQVACDTKK